MKLLKEAGIESRRGKYARDCLYIKNLKTIESLPGYKEGVFTVQDESSQLAVLVSGVKSQEIMYLTSVQHQEEKQCILRAWRQKDQ